MNKSLLAMHGNIRPKDNAYSRLAFKVVNQNQHGRSPKAERQLVEHNSTFDNRSHYSGPMELEPVQTGAGHRRILVVRRGQTHDKVEAHN